MSPSPPPGTTVRSTRSQPRWLRKALTAVRLAIHGSVGGHLLADGEDRLRWARRGWEFHRALDRLKTGSRFDESVISSITNDDEYGVVEARFKPDDIIVDVGAHIGAFTHLCHRRGSRTILGFEPDQRNFALLARNVSSLPGVEVHQRAVFRSDHPTTHLLLSAHESANTGDVTAIFGGRQFGATSTQGASGGMQGRVAETISLDEVLRRFERVRLLKLDCEGSEFPILLTAQELGRVAEVVGEYHEVSPAMMPAIVTSARLPGFTAYRKEDLSERLSRCGFQVTLAPFSQTLGLFRATRSTP